jgi:TatD DNase family protein
MLLTMVFYDTHAHLEGPDFAVDLAQVIARAQAAEVSRIMTIGTDLASSRDAIRISEHYPAVQAVVGWHPNDARSAPEDVRPELRALASHPRVVALGEMGLDYYRLPGKAGREKRPENQPLIEKQKKLFRQQLELAAELGLNCVIHQRDALEDTLELFQPWASQVRAVFHCFAGDVAALHRILELGSLVSFTGIITFPNAPNARAALAATPLDHLMLETDCPYLAPVPYRGQRCEPAFVQATAAVAATVKGCTLEALSTATQVTAETFYRLPR